MLESLKCAKLKSEYGGNIYFFQTNPLTILCCCMMQDTEHSSNKIMHMAIR